METTRSFEPGTCPLCGGKIYQLNHQFYCPDEDAHSGGLIIYADGSYRRMMRTMSTRGDS